MGKGKADSFMLPRLQGTLTLLAQWDKCLLTRLTTLEPWLQVTLICTVLSEPWVEGCPHRPPAPWVPAASHLEPQPLTAHPPRVQQGPHTRTQARGSADHDLNV